MDRITPEGVRPTGLSWAEDQLIPTDCRQGSVAFEASLMAASAATRSRLVPPVNVPTPEERLARLVRTIEVDIIPRLMDAHRLPDGSDAQQEWDVGATQPDHRPGAPRQPVRSLRDVRPELTPVRFAALVLHGDDLEFFGCVDSLVSEGCSIESLYVDLLAPTARHLGQMWVDDRCHFADVTIATGRLQQLLRRLSPLFSQSRMAPPDGRRVLLLPAPGEQHTLGLAMVADYFSRAGWLVSSGGTLVDGESHPMYPSESRSKVEAEQRFVRETLRCVRRDWFDVIGISLGSVRAVDTLRNFIAELRQASRNRGLGILVGGPLFALHPHIVQEVGADATAADGQGAPAVAEQLLSQRVSRLR